jgi:nucleoside-diphosphate-sugar epimerase
MNQPEAATILITGGSGYIGHSLVSILRGHRGRIRRMIRPGKAAPAPAGPGVEDITGDVRNRADLERCMEDADTVFHFASQTSVYAANEDPPSDLAANAVPLLNMLEICRTRKATTRILFAGTVTQTGMPSRLPVDESHPDNPVTVYCMHKLLAEFYLKHYTGICGVRGATLRLANVYGPGPESSSADRGILNMMIRKALKGETLRIYGKGDFMRDYVFVEDVARAFALAAEKADEVNGRHFVISTGTGHTLAQAINMVADRVALRTGKRAVIEHVEPPTALSPIETRSFIGDSSAFSMATGWRPSVTLQEGIDRTIDSFLQPRATP